MNEENINLIAALNFALQQMGDLLDNLQGRIVELENQIRELKK